MSGSWISIRTTSGWCRGSARSACSAVAQAQPHLQSGDKLIIVARPSRVVLLSSTMATLIIALHVLAAAAPLLSPDRAGSSNGKRHPADSFAHAFLQCHPCQVRD